MKINKPELLSPAGDMEKLIYAIEYGADAVYLAGQMYGMRAASANFSLEELKDAITYAHERGVKVYVTCNTLTKEQELPELPEYLRYLESICVDGVIVADLGVLRLIKRHAPSLNIHISTQTSIVNHEAAAMYHELGAKRVVVARELSLEEIKRIRDNAPPDLEIETFVHGAMCVSYSGRCLLSNYMTGRDASAGACAASCRWSYNLVEEKRPGEYMPVVEDERGTYILNSRDMCMIEHIPELIRCGIDSFKIEGRVKTFYYAAVITGAYRRAIDTYLENPEGWVCPPELREEVCKVSHREYFTGFYFGMKPGSEYYPDSKYIRDWNVSAVVEFCDGVNTLVTQRNRFQTGDEAELLMPGGVVIPFTIGEMKNREGEIITAAPHPNMSVSLALPVCAPKYSIIRKNISV